MFFFFLCKSFCTLGKNTVIRLTCILLTTEKELEPFHSQTDCSIILRNVL